MSLYFIFDIFKNWSIEIPVMLALGVQNSEINIYIYYETPTRVCVVTIQSY